MMSKSRQQRQVEEQLTEVFGRVLPPRVISSVAMSCGYNCKEAVLLYICSEIFSTLLKVYIK